MIHPDKNALITFYYQEGKTSERKNLLLHINFCDTCREYLQTLGSIESKLVQLTFEVPLPQTFENIKSRISTEPLKKANQPQIAFVKPILRIAFSLMGILILVYLHQEYFV